MHIIIQKNKAIELLSLNDENISWEHFKSGNIHAKVWKIEFGKTG